MRVTGVFPPIITPFDESGAIDEKRLRNLIEFWAQYVHGMFVCGSYGSGPLMSLDERKRVFEIVKDAIGKRIPLIVHVGSVNTSTSVQLAQHAQEHGAVAVAAVPPFYYKYDERSICAHFEAILASVAIPVYAYDNPKTTGNPISPTLLNQLAGLGLAGLKDSSFEIGKLYLALRTVEKQDFDFVIGSESLMLPAFNMGVRGCIAGLGNPFPEVMRHFYEVVTQGIPEDARIWQTHVLKLWDIMHLGPSVPCAYEILRLRGIDAGYPRPPFLRPEKRTIEKLQSAVQTNQAIWKLD